MVSLYVFNLFKKGIKTIIKRELKNCLRGVRRVVIQGNEGCGWLQLYTHIYRIKDVSASFLLYNQTFAPLDSVERIGVHDLIIACFGITVYSLRNIGDASGFFLRDEKIKRCCFVFLMVSPSPSLFLVGIFVGKEVEGVCDVLFSRTQGDLIPLYFNR